MADHKAMEEQVLLGGTAIKPVGWDRTGLEALRYTIWNPDTGEVLTRTPMSWLKITLFYCVYYSFLAAFWIGCLNIFFCTLPEAKDGPRWTQDYSIIGVNPGVGLRPRNEDRKIDSQMFVLKAGDDNLLPSARKGEGSINADYAARMKEFLKVYNIEKRADYHNFDPVAELGVCGKFPYGYVETKDDDGTINPVSPCIFVKLNTIWGWEPKEVDCGEEEKQDSCPTTLTDHLATTDAGTNNVWIDCIGRYAADQEALSDGGLTYFPSSRAIPMKYFPYTGKVKDIETGNVTEAYHSPLVAIKVNPKNKGQMVHIECRAYYKGVKHITKTKEGLVQFEVQILV